MRSDIITAIDQICQEKKLSKEKVLEAIEQALAAAYRRDFGEKDQNIKVKFEPETGQMQAFDVKTVVEDVPPEEISEIAEDEEKATKEKNEIQIENSEEAGEKKKRFNPRTEIQLSDAKKIGKKYKLGDEIIKELEIPSGFGRIAAQTAKQVIIQRLREAERETIFTKYSTMVNTVIDCVIQRIEPYVIFIDLADATAILPRGEQVREEKYWAGQKIKDFIGAVNQTPRGSEIIVSRRHPDILRELFRIEIPEIANNLVEIKNIAREAGSRSKVAVWTAEKGLDPVGSCIGQRGVRIQTIISEIGGEKIDIIEYSDEPEKFIANALSPAKVSSLKIIEKEKSAIAKVKRNQLSLAIGRAGQNVRLASRLTGWRIDVQEEVEEKIEEEKIDKEAKEEKEEKMADKKEEKKKKTKRDKKVKKEESKTE